MRASIPHDIIAAAALTLTALSACSPAVPESPTWTQDVRPIVMANCARCHTDPPTGNAPDYFRLDVYQDWAMADGTAMAGAQSMAGRIAARGADADRPMPPEIGPLGRRQQDVLQRWVDQGAPMGPIDDANQAPGMTVTPGAIDPGTQTVAIDYQITDLDGDPVIGILRADELVISTRLHSAGTGQVTWDLTGVAAATYQLSAELDDGNQRVAIQLGTFDVP